MNKIFVMGDIHGSNRAIKHFMKRAKAKENFDGSDTMILLGDAGLNYNLDTFDSIRKRVLGNYPFTYFIIRGNHEERPSECMKMFPDRWTTEEFFGNTVYVEKEFPYIKYALDEPTIYTIPHNGKVYKTLIFPGAYSVDKEYRLKVGHKWFPKEQMTEEEMNIGRKLVMENPFVDLVLSHTCPCIYEPTDLFFPFIDQSKVDKTMEKYLGEIECVLEYKAWMWGHYHETRFFEERGSKKMMLFEDVIELNEFFEKETPVYW